MVVPMTVCKDRTDWYSEDFTGDREPGLRTGEFAGVIFREAPDPGTLLFWFQGVLAMTLATSDALPMLMAGISRAARYLLAAFAVSSVESMTSCN